MKNLIFALTIAGSFSAFAVDGLTIPNSHQVDQDGQVFRGREPKKLVRELKDFGITDVLIFKNEVRTEVTDEIAALKKLKIKSHHIPFKWKELESFELACGQLIDGVKLIKKVKEAGGYIFFHCTAGEDRTGMLAGVYRMLEENQSSNKMFKTEMCGRGYSDGNPHKPSNVHGAIKKELTPLFIAISKKIEDGELSMDKLSKTVCKSLEIEETDLTCKSVK